MEKFPKIECGQVALMRADKNTGIVMDEKFEHALTDEQKVYTVFDSHDSAIEYAKRISSERKYVEIVIYGQNMEVLTFVGL